MRVGNIDGDKGGNVAMFSNAHTGIFCINFRISTYIGFFTYLGRTIDPHQWMIRIVSVIDHTQK